MPQTFYDFKLFFSSPLAPRFFISLNLNGNLAVSGPRKKKTPLRSSSAESVPWHFIPFFASIPALIGQVNCFARCPLFFLSLSLPLVPFALFHLPRTGDRGESRALSRTRLRRRFHEARRIYGNAVLVFLPFGPVCRSVSDSLRQDYRRFLLPTDARNSACKSSGLRRAAESAETYNLKRRGESSLTRFFSLFAFVATTAPPFGVVAAGTRTYHSPHLPLSPPAHRFVRKAFCRMPSMPDWGWQGASCNIYSIHFRWLAAPLWKGCQSDSFFYLCAFPPCFCEGKRRGGACP